MNQTDMYEQFDALERAPVQARELHRVNEEGGSRRAAAELVADQEKLARRYRQAYLAVAKHGPATSTEIEELEGVREGVIRKRLAQLRTRGLVKVVGYKQCLVTGSRDCKLWSVHGVDVRDKKGSGESDEQNHDTDSAV